MSEEHGHDVDSWVRRYRWIGASLFVLTVVTVAASYVNFGFALGIAIALLIALFKGSLVATIFMHLIEEKPIILSILGLTVVFFFFLMLIPLFWHFDATVAIP